MVVADNRTQRAIEPFSYFPRHASAISGLGGPDTSPDPNYCFHTHYQEFKPGVVLLRAKLSGARATEGELAVRVHAYRPNSALDVSLVAGSRTPLNGLDGSDLEIAIRVAAIPGVQYALFGYFSEPSDLVATGLSIVVDELGGDNPEDFISADTARSLFEAASVDMPNRLLADIAPNFVYPVSQSLTVGQIESVEYRGSWPEIPEDGTAVRRWRQAFALQALEAYGMLRTGASGLLVREDGLPVAAAIQAHGCSLVEIQIAHIAGSRPEGSDQNDAHRQMAPADMVNLRGQFDFAVAISSPQWFTDKAAWFNFVVAVVRQVLRGGISVILFDYAAGVTDEFDVGAAQDGFRPRKGDIEQLAMRIISHGSDVAQLSFADGTGTNRAVATVCPFGFIVRR
jgi:hypothetical protein